MPEDPATADPRIAILQARYVALTTYRLDGRAVVTPVWAAEREGRLLIFSNPSAGKMKRLRNSARASVAPCTWNGTLTGVALPATARILAPEELSGMWGALVKKYGLPALGFRIYDRLRQLLRLQASAGIEVSLNP
jgi:PPOX class probable F420-dependent enzyme